MSRGCWVCAFYLPVPLAWSGVASAVVSFATDGCAEASAAAWGEGAWLMAELRELRMGGRCGSVLWMGSLLGCRQAVARGLGRGEGGAVANAAQTRGRWQRRRRMGAGVARDGATVAASAERVQDAGEGVRSSGRLPSWTRLG